VDKPRIFMASTNASQQAAFVPEGAISFSKFFWRDVAAGANVGQAFSTANQAINLALGLQTPGLDDTGNGIVNEKLDGPTLARNYSLGTGIITAGDAPSILGDTGNQTIASGTVANFGVTGVTTTGTIATVWALIMPPGYSPAMPQLLTSVNLAPFGPATYVASYAGFTEQGDYTLAVFAEDIDGVISQPRVMTVTQPSGEFAATTTDADCFLTVAAYGTQLASRLDSLRRFRDQRLLPGPLGTALVDAYYRLSPPAARAIAQHPQLRAAVRVILGESIEYGALALSFPAVPFAVCLLFPLIVRRRPDA
jgi:hypothetical protein